MNVGSGQTYSTNGVNDQVAINNAISAAKSGDTVYIHASTYSISAPINVGKSNIVIKGDGPQSTVICAASYDDFFGTKHNDLTRSFIQLKAVDNVEIYGFTLKGTYPQIEPDSLSKNGADSSENGMLLINYVTNTKIHDIVFTRISGDGIYVCDSYNPNKNNDAVYNCVFDTDNHDCIEAWSVSNWNIYNCTMNFTSNCGVRFVDSKDSEISNCTMYAPAGNCASGGIYFQKNNENITVDWNVFHDIQVVPGYGIYVTGEESGHVTIHDNVFYNCRGGGIHTGNLEATTYNNLYPSTAFDWTAAGYGYGAKISEPTAAQSIAAQSIDTQPVLPVANFTTNVTRGYAPLSVQFNDTSSNVIGWNWDFGDGATSSEQNPMHTFSTAGNYMVNLTVSNANSTDSIVKTITVINRCRYRTCTTSK